MSKPIPALPRLLARMVPQPGPLPTDCWISTAAPSGFGYTVMRFNGRREYTHRVAYTVIVGPILEGMTIDHLCRVRACINPAHLEAVTHRENNLRGTSPGANAVRTGLCKRGHLLSETAYIRPDGKGRDCYLCMAIRESRRPRSPRAA